MVNEDRLQQMIKMAVFDKEDGKECRPMEQYERNDYVALKFLESFVTGTIAFGLLFVMWALYEMDELLNTLNTMDLVGFLVPLVIKYVVFLFFYLMITYIVYQKRYTNGRRKVKKYYNSVKKLNRLYEREDKLKLPAAGSQKAREQ